MNLANFATQLFIEVKEWVEDLIVKERALTDDKLDDISDEIRKEVVHSAARNDVVMELIDQLTTKQGSIDKKQEVYSEAIKELEEGRHELLQKWADELIAAAEKQTNQFKDMAENVVSIESDIELRLEEFETKMISDTLSYEEKFCKDYLNVLTAELLEEGEVLEAVNG